MACVVMCSGADLLAVNADGNMAYDLCDDLPTLEYIETEMSRRGLSYRVYSSYSMSAFSFTSELFLVLYINDLLSGKTNHKVLQLVLLVGKGKGI